jgi:hypothetical protein
MLAVHTDLVMIYLSPQYCPHALQLFKRGLG